MPPPLPLLVPLLQSMLLGPLTFAPRVVDADFPGGYALALADIDGDGRRDIVALSTRAKTLAWYESPSWTRHVLVDDMDRPISVAAEDLDGDGAAELVVAAAFGQTDETSEGILYLLTPGEDADRRRPWTAREIDRVPTSHRLRFADVDGDGKSELVNLPLTGAGARGPSFDAGVPLVIYETEGWSGAKMFDAVGGVAHGLRVVKWDEAPGEAVLSASFEGVWLHRQKNGLWYQELLVEGDPSPRPRSGASEIAVGGLGDGERFLATIEPWHGSQVVVYTRSAEAWKRDVVDEGLLDGHALEVADLDGDGTGEIVAGFRGEGASVYVYARSGEGWVRQTLDDGGMAAADCEIEDLDGDGALDVVCIGSSTGNVKLYRNVLEAAH